MLAPVKLLCFRNSPAEKAGIMAEDVITQVGGIKIDKEHSLASLVQRSNVGDTITLKVLRGEKELSILVKLEERK